MHDLALRAASGEPDPASWTLAQPKSRLAGFGRARLPKPEPAWSRHTGALHFRGFSASTTKPGFRRFCEALPLQPCTDPLASIGVRSLLSKDEGASRQL